MPRRGERRGRVRCSNLFASGCTFFSLMIEELWDLYASPRTVITPLPIPGQPRFHVYPEIMQKHHSYCSDSCCCQIPEDPEGLNAWTRHFRFHKCFHFIAKPKKVAWKAEVFFVSWGGSKRSKQWELEKHIGWRDKERLRENHRGPHCAQVILWC